MNGIWGVIIGTMLSGLIWSFLLHMLNIRTGMFNIIQEDLAKLSKGTRGILSVYGYVSIIAIIGVLVVIFSLSPFEAVCTLGFCYAVRDTCFKNNIVEHYLGKSKSKID